MRECGDCRVCCTIGEVPEINKPSHVQCPHVCPTGCDIFDQPERPKVCNSFECAWKRGMGDEGERPDLIGAMFTINNESVGMADGPQQAPIIYAVELEPDTVQTKAKNMAVKMIDRFRLPIVVIGSDERPPDDYGHSIVLSPQMMTATQKIRGEELESLSPTATLYELKHGNSSRCA